MDNKLRPDIFNSAYPIVGIDLYKGGLIVRRSGENDTKPLSTPPKRGKVSHLSRRSLSKLAFLAHTTSVTFSSLLTLTYGLEYPTCGKLLKSHLNSFLVQSRRLFEYHDYLWFLEFQQRGAPHIHLLTTLPAPTEVDRYDMATLWTRIVLGRHDRKYSRMSNRQVRSLTEDMIAVHQHPKTWEGVRAKDGARRYVVKYATKTYQKIVPAEFSDVGRFWACSRPVRVSPSESVSLWSDEDTLRKVLWIIGRSDLLNYGILPRNILIPRDVYDTVKNAAQGKGDT